jgi:hypothetical protein
MEEYELHEERVARDAKKLLLAITLASLLYSFVQAAVAVGWISDNGITLISMLVGVCIWILIGGLLFSKDKSFREKGDTVILICVVAATGIAVVGIFWQPLRSCARWLNVLPGVVIFGTLMYLRPFKE